MGFEGTLWMKRALPVLADRDRSALVVGDSRFGWYRVWNGEVLLGQVGSPERRMTYPAPTLFSLAPGSGDEILIEYHRYAWAADLFGDEVGPSQGGVFVGDSTEMAQRLELEERRRRMGDLTSLLLATLFLVTGLYHLDLYLWRRSERAYLWFGIACLALTGNTIVFTAWVAEPLGWLTVPWRLNESLGHVATASLIQFLWTILDRPMGRALRWYRTTHWVLAAALMALPFPWLFESSAVRQAWTWPILLVAGWTLVAEARRGHPEARPLLVGGGVFLLTMALELIRGQFPVIPGGLPPIGFAILLVSMALGLGRRVSRVHQEIEVLRTDLERMVVERTSQLARTMEELSRASDAKSAFLANMSHELRTPLNSVVGFSELLLSDDSATLGPFERRSVGHIHSSGEHLRKLVNQVLDITAVEAGRIDITPQPTDIGPFVKDVLSEMIPAIAGQSLQLEVDVPDEPDIVFTDPLRLRQVLLNLVGNAVKFTDEGTVRVQASRDTDGHMVIVVADTGIGIPENRLQAVFEPFERQGADGPEREGTGLGLSISSALCERLGAQLDVTSEVGVGSTFRVTMPEALVTHAHALDRGEDPPNVG